MKAWLGKVEGFWGRQARWLGKAGHEGMVRQGGRQKIRHGGSGKAGGQARRNQAIVRRPRRQIVGPGEARQAFKAWLGGQAGGQAGGRLV